ncbi:MAG TPA: PAS domain S-box protein [Candidatus Polarisedimenticolaceae bacterium]|nr:PAS domain S-box protein [Candidatus Polarisedimenticolaceae bacterium]
MGNTVLTRDEQLHRRIEDLDRELERLRTTLGSIGDGVIATDTDGRVVSLNGVAEKLTGWRSDEASGLFVDDVFKIVSERTRLPVENPVGRVLREGAIVGLANHTVLIAKDGTEWAIDDSAAPIRNEAGQVTGCVLIFRDVTDRRKLEKENMERLAASRLLASIVESSTDAIVSKTLDGTIRSWNQGAELLFGHTREEAIGRPITLIIPTDRLQEEQEIVRRIGAGERVEHFETVRIRRDGSTVDVSLTISPIRDEEGRVIGASKIARDISDRKQDEQRIYALLAELREADRLKDEFLAMLGHELRNPMAPISNMLEILKRAQGDEALVQQARSTMERQLGQLARLVDDLVDVSRITRGKLELRKERVEIASAVHHAVESCQPIAERSHVHLDVSLPVETIYVNADPIRLVQAIGNLLNNACKFSPEGGHVSLSVEREDGEVKIAVKDQGIGIPKEKLDRVFDMFVQLDRALERTGAGLGIGLTLVKRIVRMLDGTVTARSEGRGRGSEFIVRLPVVLERRAQRRSVVTPEPPVVAVHRILVVDDNVDAASSLATLLRISGNETHVAHDGVAAIEVAERLRPDVILLDIGLPRLNGYDACRRMRERPWGSDVVIVAMTGWGQESDRRKSRDAGFDHHMVKPVDYGALMGAIAQGRGAAS